MSSRNVSYIYSKESTTLFPSFLVYHTNPNYSTLYIEVNSKQLLYAKKPSHDNYKANLLVKYKLTLPENQKDVLDSGSVILEHLSDEYDQKENLLIGKIHFNAISGKKYLLQ